MTEQPGRIWFDKFMAAFAKADLDAIWELQTKASHALILERMAATVERTRTDPDFREALNRQMGIDIHDADPKLAWQAYTQASALAMARGAMTWRYVGEEANDGRIVVRMIAEGPAVPAAMSGELVQVLVEEDGELRLDKPASAEHGA